MEKSGPKMTKVPSRHFLKTFSPGSMGSGVSFGDKVSSFSHFSYLSQLSWYVKFLFVTNKLGKVTRQVRECFSSSN